MNNFAKYWAELGPQEKRELAQRAETSVNYLSQVANGHKQAGWKTVRGLAGAIDPSLVMKPEFFESPPARAIGPFHGP